jgi:hypothetical protein
MFVLSALIACATPAAAQITLDFHQTNATFSCAGIDPATVTCDDIDATGPYAGGAEQIIILIGGANAGATAVQFGITYDSTGETALWSVTQPCVASYQSIAILGPNGTYPNSGSGVAIAFGECVTPVNDAGIIPVSFLFSATSATIGNMTFTPDPGEGALKIVDCSDLTISIDPANTGTFDFEGAGGVVKCGTVVPTEEKSWGQIKALF